MNIALIRVGADTGNLGFHGKIFDDNTFVYIPINENSIDKTSFPETYSTIKTKFGKNLIDYIPQDKFSKFKDTYVHHDPEFETFTYGDPNFNKNGLKKLEKGDYLLFYSSLTNSSGLTCLYLIGYFELEQNCVCVQDVNLRDSLINSGFKNNFHVKNERIFKRDVETEKNRGLKLIKGSKNSKLLEKAYKISDKKAFGSDGKERFVVSDEMKKVFGDFKGKICIQRNSLRFVDENFVEKTRNWLLSLK
ncbi:MAG TPA: hypothetical protein DEP28_04875 [Bacteroidetes bacterium]|nr:hypothetical protein [Bacteroidota bacterium]HCN36444.1 hypothetical protein [Bacteroidota bacterium]